MPPLFLTQDDLPPKPDRETGEPRPPRAPDISGAEPLSKRDVRRVRSGKRRPAPPPGEGPLLEWFKPSPHEHLTTGTWVFLLFVVGVTVEQGGDPAWMGFWQVWVVLLPMLLGIHFAVRPAECAAGAEWLRVGRKWVRLYEIVTAEADRNGSDLRVTLEDGPGRRISVRAKDLQKDRELWDLVYNGILHSVIAGGAETNSLLHSALSVPRDKNRPGTARPNPHHRPVPRKRGLTRRPDRS